MNFKGPHGPWKGPIFVWKPVKDIHGHWCWLCSVYRRERNRMVWPHQGWEYGNVFDVLKDV